MMEFDNALGLILGVSFSILGAYTFQTNTGVLKYLSLALIVSGLYAAYYFWAWDEYMVNG